MKFEDTLWPDGTLKNLLGIHDPKTLARIEYEHTLELSAYLIDHPIKITSFHQLIEIHRYLFQSLYLWAGEIRTYDMRKGETVFMPHSHMTEAITFINTMLKKLQDGHLNNRKYAMLLDSINYLHPFREGNGRSTRLFLQLLALQHRQFIDYPRHLSKLIQAEKNSDIQALAGLLVINNDLQPEGIKAHLLKLDRKAPNNVTRQQWHTS